MKISPTQRDILKRMVEKREYLGQHAGLYRNWYFRTDDKVTTGWVRHSTLEGLVNLGMVSVVIATRDLKEYAEARLTDAGHREGMYLLRQDAKSKKPVRTPSPVPPKTRLYGGMRYTNVDSCRLAQTDFFRKVWQKKGYSVRTEERHGTTYIYARKK